MARRDAGNLNRETHVEAYLASDGEYGHDWRGCPTLLLTTRGRRSGLPRTMPLIYGRRGDDYLVVASKGGSPQAPYWYENLRAHPEAEVQILAERFAVRARDARPDEHPDLWEEMCSLWPDFDAYQRRTDRRIPVVVLTPEPFAAHWDPEKPE